MFMSELTIQFGQLVRKYRKERNMSQEQLALLCNMDRSYLGRIERGEVNPTLEKIYELSSFLDVEVVNLLPRK
ncbi:helix-turn-helix domain-containing protein [Acinetobacter baumannii]|uniref:helix-turn-helix domain-containing protein n=1 Tax=Acinetobacter baumannii TaxID=470 RepID=UPI0023425BDE|nr:helix-turn-helix domain-containing protein [Acinetobacter baumannii]MDC5141189.1 helix-turn-helix domain-containing protein [Acinetobacter baumannii]